MALYNITGFQDATTISDMVVYSNNITDQVFMGVFTYALFFMFLMIFKKSSDFEESIIASSFIMFILSLFLRNMGLVNFIVPLSFITILAIMLFFFYKDNNPFR